MQIYITKEPIKRKVYMKPFRISTTKVFHLNFYENGYNVTETYKDERSLIDRLMNKNIYMQHKFPKCINPHEFIHLGINIYF